MDQKVHPEGCRLRVKREGARGADKSNWYSDRD